VSVFKSTSQPSSGLLLQSARPGKQVTLHCRFLHALVAPFTEQDWPHAPQFFASSSSAASQPSAPTPLQSVCVPSHVGLHDPSAHERALTPAAPHDVSHAPQ
jgi:hypothetical protein